MNIRILTFFVATLLLLGCGEKDPNKQIIGTWQASGDVPVTFLSNGSLLLGSDKSSEKKDNSLPDPPKTFWQIMPDGKLRMYATFLGTNTDMSVSKVNFDGSEMILTRDNGKVTRYKKAS